MVIEVPTIEILSDVDQEESISRKRLKELEETEKEYQSLDDFNPAESKEIISNKISILVVDDDDKDISKSYKVSKRHQKKLSRKRPQNNFSTYNDDLTIEESEERINILLVVFAFVLINIATSFTIIVIKNVPQDPVTFPWALEIYQPQNGMLLK